MVCPRGLTTFPVPEAERPWARTPHTTQRSTKLGPQSRLYKLAYARGKLATRSRPVFDQARGLYFRSRETGGPLPKSGTVGANRLIRGRPIWRQLEALRHGFALCCEPGSLSRLSRSPLRNESTVIAPDRRRNRPRSVLRSTTPVAYDDLLRSGVYLEFLRAGRLYFCSAICSPTNGSIYLHIGFSDGALRPRCLWTKCSARTNFLSGYRFASNVIPRIFAARAYGNIKGHACCSIRRNGRHVWKRNLPSR